MSRGKAIEINLMSLFDDLNNVKDVKLAIRSLFSDYQKLITSFENYFEEKCKVDVKDALDVNRKYYDVVLSKNDKYDRIVENNLSSLRDAIRSNDDKLIKIEYNSDELKFESEIIINNRDIDVKKEIIDARKKLGKLIQASNEEIEVIKDIYLKNSDKHLANKQIELDALAKEYQQNLEDLRQKMRTRNQVYEQQVSKNRQVREQYVLNHSEKYKEIKNLHTSFSIYYNSKIDELSKKYRYEVKLLNEEYNEKTSKLNEQISVIEKNVLSKEIDTKTLIHEKSESLKKPYHEARTKYEQELRFLVTKHDEELQGLSRQLSDFERAINLRIKRYNDDFEEGDKSKEARKQLNNFIKPLLNALNKEKKLIRVKKKELTKEHRLKVKNLYDEFHFDKIKLDKDFIFFEYEALIDNASYFEECLLKINLLNLQIEKLEEEKNQKIWLLTNAYNHEIGYIEKILALGSERQEFMIQDQVGNNSFILASSQLNNEIIKSSFEVDSERSNLEIKILKIIYLNNVKKVTAKYQLLIQEEMIKRDTVIKQYEYEIEIEKENLKLVELNSNLEFSLLKLKTEYELELELRANEQKSDKLNYFLNLTKIKLDDINKKHEATLEFDIAEAKASRNMFMYKLDAEKIDRYYVQLFETLINHHEKIDNIVKIMKFSYAHPEFSMTKFYHLIDLVIDLLPHIQEESDLLISYFKGLTDQIIVQKIDELTGFHYRNKLQSILDQNASSEEIIKQDIEQIVEERSLLTADLVTFEQASHRFNIQISQLYRDIQSLKEYKDDVESRDQLIKLKVELANINNQLKFNAKQIKQLQKQILSKDDIIAYHEKRLKKLTRQYEGHKKKLGNQVKKEAKTYYREKENNINEFAKLKKLIDTYVQNKIKNLTKLKRNLIKTVDAIEIFSKDNEKTRLKYMDNLFKSLERFRKVVLRIYYSQEKDQKNISTGFNISYNILVRNLNQNYRNSYLKEKRKNLDNKKAYENDLIKLKQKYDLDVLKANRTFQSRADAINQQLMHYDEAFRNTFVYRRNYVRTLTVNQLELNKGLDQNTDELTKMYTDEFEAFYTKKRSLLRDLSQKQYRLFNSTINRSLQYRDNYLETKHDVSDALKDGHKENLLIVKNKEREYRKSLVAKRHEERQEHITFREKLKNKTDKITLKYQANLKKINS